MARPRDFAVVRKAVAEMVAQDPSEYFGILDTMEQVAEGAAEYRRKKLGISAEPFDRIAKVLGRASRDVYKSMA